MVKAGCIFLSGMLLGMMLVMLVTLTILDNRMDSVEPSLSAIQYEVDAMAIELNRLRDVSKVYYTQAGNARKVMQECIDIGRKEVNGYNRALEGE